MRVLGIGKFYPPEYVGGLESVVVTLNRELVRRGIGVSYVVSRVRGAGRVDDVDGVRVVRTPSAGTLLSQPLSPGLPAAVRREPGDIVHLHHPNPLGDLAVLRDRRPLVITQHSDVVRQRALRGVYGPLIRGAVARARFVAIASPQLLAGSEELRGFGAKVRVIPFGIDPARFAATPAVTARAAALRTTLAGGPVVLAVGRLVGYKGFDVLIRAIDGTEARLVLVGTGPEEPRLRAVAGPRVTFTGRVTDDDLVAGYHAADVFCLPSVTRAEAFGVVLLEAMACAKPLVTTALPTGVSAVNRDGVTGLAVPPGDPDALRDAIGSLLASPARRMAMGAEGRRVLEREYTAALMGERYQALYEEALA